MNHIANFAKLHTDEEVVNHVLSYNYRPIEGDIVEVAVANGHEKFLLHLLDEEKEHLLQKHMSTAVDHNKINMVKFIVSRGLSVNDNIMGRSYLGYATFMGGLAMARTLLKLGAKVDDKNHRGHTALMSCAGWWSNTSDISVMKLLLEHGADERLTTPDGKSLRSLLKLWKKPHIYTEAESVLKSVETWREWKNFPEVCTSFANVYYKQKEEKQEEKTFLELHPDLLTVVISFFKKSKTSP